MSHNKTSLSVVMRTAFIAVLALALLAGCGGKDKAAGGEIVATYDNGQITKEQFDSYLKVTSFLYPQYEMFAEIPEFQEMMLQQLVAFHVISGLADSKIKKDAADEVDKQFKEFKEMYAAQMGKPLKDDLKEIGLTEAELKSNMADSLTALEYLEQQVSEQSVKDEYDERVKQDPKSFIDTATVSHILIGLEDLEGNPLRTKEEALDLAKTVKTKLLDGADFAELVQQYSDDEGSKATGGTYEYANVFEWVEPFREAAIDLPLNTISDPVETEYGYHVMKVTWRNPNAFDDVKDHLKQEMIGVNLSDFVEKELPKLNYKSNLPKTESSESDEDAPADPSADSN